MPAKLLIVVIGLACLGAWFWPDDRVRVPAAVSAGEPKEKQLTKLYFGVSLCRKCHDEKEPVPDKSALLYRGTEMHTWDKFDKHKDATRVLKGERSQQMAKLLGWEVATDARCLNCHGVVVGKNDKFDEESFDPPQREESGVSCVVCHGPYAEWVNNHVKLVGGNWKKLTRADKERDHGLTDLWDPARRAALCCTCHVGSVPEGKVVTHEMYAAGHPPLPGIEVATFSDAMPRHWETLSEKVTKRPQHKEFHKRIHGFDADVDDNEQARLLAISSVVALRAAVQLLHDLAQQDISKPNAQNPAWPELASFDCYACHHDLKSESWRQLRTSTGRPGRPQLRPWPLALAPLGIRHSLKHGGEAGGLEFQQKLSALDDVFNKTPFGEPRAAVDHAGALLASSDKLVKALQGSRFDRATAHDMLLSLLQRPEKELLDFDSARQIAWGAQALFPTVAPEAAKRPAVIQQLDVLQKQLMLELPKGQVRIAEEYMPQVLKRIGTYDPREFQKTLRLLAAEAGKKNP